MAAEAESGTPVGRNHIIERPRLTRLLDETTARVIMLVAPAGYGKTTLARQWLATRPHAWYQGTAASSDVAALALGIADAAGAILPGVGQRLREWLPTSREPEKEVGVMAELLSEDLADWPDDVWFVIDDYHLLSSEASADLTQRLFIAADRRLLLTSRRRPAWSSARELLYGNFFELGQSTLAMTTDEANAVLTNHAQAVSGLVALANGWPAVIGLAALTPISAVSASYMPEMFHHFLAEELFESLSPAMRSAACRLALLPTISREATNAMLGPSTDEILESAQGAGVLMRNRSTEFAMHPLLRTFFVMRLAESGRDETASAVTAATGALIRLRSWDEAFSLLSRFSRDDLLDRLLSSALSTLTKEGRLATIKEWVEFGRSHSYASPYIDLAEGELAFRLGHYDRAGALAGRAAEALPKAEPLHSAAHFRAGQARHFLDDAQGALGHFEAAHVTATNDVDARNALWGQFTISSQLEDRDPSGFLKALSRFGAKDRDGEVRVSCGTLTLALRGGSLREALSEVAPTKELVSEARDPLVRSAFWRGLGGALVLHGDYVGARHAIAAALEEADRFHLRFVRPHALVSDAAASIGLRELARARDTIREIEEAAGEMGDPYLAGHACILLCRLLLVEGRIETALEMATELVPATGATTRRVEFVATRAAAIACAGRPEEAKLLLRTVEGLTGWTEPSLLVQWAGVVTAIAAGDAESLSQIDSAYANTVQRDAFDPFVFAYRLQPSILPAVFQKTKARKTTRQVLARANDEHFARQQGVALPPDPRAQHALLTPREQEVLRLLGKGLSNRQIAETLCISEPTAKVHVRNILRKLRASTRTQAALIAAGMELDRSS